MNKDLRKAAEDYADERLSVVNPDISKSSYSRHTKMALPLFDGCELESAFEEGANWQKKKTNSELIRVYNELRDKRVTDFSINIKEE